MSLRPGSVKQARADSGLSLAQLGRGQVTAPAIYLIETGRTRPSLPTLEHIARKTGKPVEFFLADPGGSVDETQTALVSLEAHVAAGRYEQAIALGRSLLERGVSAHGLGRIRYFLAVAYIRLGEPSHAEGMLAEARGHFEAVNDRFMVAECLGAEATLAALAERPGALALAEQALDACRALEPVPAPMEMRFLTLLAAAHLARHDWEQAAGLYQEAIQAAGQVSDLRRHARLYEELSAAYQDLGQVETASRYATRSLALLGVLEDRVSLARAETSLGLLLSAKGADDAARHHLDRAQELGPEDALEPGRSHVLLNLCELCLQNGDHAKAARFAAEALALAERLNEGADAAEAHVWLGRIAGQAGDHDASDTEFELAIKAYESLEMRERLLRCHGAYAEVLEKRGELSKAYVHMKLALQASRPGLLRPDENARERATSV